MEHIQQYRGIHFGSSCHLNPDQMERLKSLFHTLPQPPESALGGRTGVVFSMLEGIGSIAVKPYRRGGLLGRFIKNKYLKTGRSRGQREYEMLKKVTAMGISVPEPIAYAYWGGLSYQAWLITRKIDRNRTLAQLSREDKTRWRGLMDDICRQISILINHRVLHVDLHPGNIIIDLNNRVYLIDFDKGRFSHLSATRLRNRYIHRWQRAVKKHQLPDLLTDALLSGLNRNRT